MASSGIAATLLNGGRTGHSAFKLPLDLARHDTPFCNIKKNSAMAKVLQRARIIIWDEATMSHKNIFLAIDNTLRDVRGKDCIMGGVTVLLAGDFRQTLPVIARGTRADEINACLKSCFLWQNV